MSRLPEKAVEEFKELWKKRGFEPLSDSDMEARANHVFEVLRPMAERSPEHEEDMRNSFDSAVAAEERLASLRTEISAEVDS